MLSVALCTPGPNLPERLAAISPAIAATTVQVRTTHESGPSDGFGEFMRDILTLFF